MKKSNTGGVLIVIAILLAAALAFGLFKFLDTQKTTVYLFNDDYPAGTMLTSSMLTAVEVDRTMTANNISVGLDSQYVTEDNKNEAIRAAAVLRVDVYKGTALMKGHLSNMGGTRAEMNMKPDAIAVSVAVDMVTAGSSDVTVGSYVNVYANYALDDREVTYLIVQGARVIDVNTNPESSMPESVTLELDHEQALKVVHAQQFGDVQLAVIDKNGYQYETESSMPSYEIQTGSAGTTGQTAIIDVGNDE